MLTPVAWLKSALPAGFRSRLRVRWWQLKEACALDHSAIRWPWFRWPDSPSHDEALRQDWRRIRTVEGRAVLFLWSVAWPLVAMARIGALLAAERRAGSGRYGISPVRQAVQLVVLACRYNCPPASYYKFRLFQAADPGARSLEYVHHYQICNLLTWLNDGEVTRPLDDKVMFGAAAAAHGLRAAPVTVAFDKADERGRVDPPRLPPTDLVMKARDLSCGAWFERWDYTGSGQWRRGDQLADEAGLVAHARARSADRGVFIQQRLTNHEELSRLAGKGLSTLRLVTSRDESGAVSTVMGAFRMPRGESVVDNFAAGGLAAPVNLETGILGVAVAKAIGRGEFTHHPDSGAPIQGTRLPWWRECLDLVHAAHSTLAPIPFVGWDVVIAPDGPLLLEANTTWCVDLLQMPNRTPLGHVVFPRVNREIGAPRTHAAR